MLLRGFFAFHNAGNVGSIVTKLFLAIMRICSENNRVIRRLSTK